MSKMSSFFRTDWSMNNYIMLESVNYFGTSEYFSGRKKKTPYKQNFNGKANWLGVVNFCCVQMSLVKSMWFIFSDD